MLFIRDFDPNSARCFRLPFSQFVRNREISVSTEGEFIISFVYSNPNRIKEQRNHSSPRSNVATLICFCKVTSPWNINISLSLSFLLLLLSSDKIQPNLVEIRKERLKYLWQIKEESSPASSSCTKCPSAVCGCSSCIQFTEHAGQQRGGRCCGGGFDN